MKDLIKLASAHVTQYTNDNVKTDWYIRENKTDKDLGLLPARLTEAEVFAILNFAREYELEAFNKGIEFQKKKQNNLLKGKINELTAKLKDVLSRNDVLATQLDKMTRGA